MSTAVLAAAAGGLLGGLVVLLTSSIRQRADRTRLLRRLESAFARISGPQASSLFETGLPTELALERMEDAIEHVVSSSATVLESFSILCRAFDEIGVAAAVYTVSGEEVYQNRPAKLLLENHAKAGLSSALETLVSKSLWNGEPITEEFHPAEVDSPSVSVRVIPLDGRKKRLGVIAILAQQTPLRAIDPEQLCRHVAEKLRESAIRKSVSLLVYEPPPTARPGSVVTSAEVIEDVLEELATKAVSLSRPGSSVEIGSARVRDEVWLWVADEVDQVPSIEGPEPRSRSTGARFEKILQDSSSLRYLAESVGTQLDCTYIEGKGRRFTLRFSRRSVG